MSWWQGVRREAKCELEEVLKLVDEAWHDVEETELDSFSGAGQRRTSWSTKAVRRRSDASCSLFNLMDESDVDGAPVVRHPTECRRWLMTTFTQADLTAAEGHEAAGSEELHGSGSHRHSFVSDDADEDDKEHEAEGCTNMRARRTTQELDLCITGVLDDPEIVDVMHFANGLAFDTLRFTSSPVVGGRPLQYLGHKILKDKLIGELTRQGKIPEAVTLKFRSCMVRFLGAIDALYNANVPYHNSAHAADVMMTMEWLLSTEYMRSQVSTLDHLLVMVAAAIHDVGHPGRNNLFLTKTMAPLAVTYNDKSVLENMHLAKSFETMQKDEETNWFALLPRSHRDEDGNASPDLQQYVRRGLIDMVLATDMTKHAEQVQKVELLAEAMACKDESTPASSSGSHASKQEALEKKLCLLECTLHAADISNPCKPRPIMLQWTERVLEEFWAQGDEERALGVDISPLCDRESGRKTVPKGQIGFINFVIQPFYSPLAEVIPEVQEALDELMKNRSFWEEMEREQVPIEQLFDKNGSSSKKSDATERGGAQLRRRGGRM